jgi:hypothetical protein
MPQNLLGGNLTFYLNDNEYFPKINTNEQISFVTLNFTGSGDNTLEIFGTTYLSGLTEITNADVPLPDLTPSVDYDFELIYVLTALLIIGGIASVIVFKRKRK